MLNRVILMGRLTRDPELRATGTGVSVATFSLAVDAGVKDNNGEKITDFFDVIAWRKTAELVSTYFSKGRMMIVEGRLRTETWEDKTSGKTRKSVKIVAEKVFFGDSKKDDTPAPSAPYQSAYSNAPNSYQESVITQQGFTDVTDEDDDLPF